MMDCEGSVITAVNNNSDSGQTYSIRYRQGDSGSDVWIMNNNKTGLNVKSGEMALYSKDHVLIHLQHIMFTSAVSNLATRRHLQV